MRFQARMNDQELSCNDKKRAIREHMRRFNHLNVNVCVIRSCDDVSALRRLLKWLDPALARPIRHKLGKVAPALLECIELWARQLEIELPAGRDTVIERQPIGGDLFIPGDG